MKPHRQYLRYRTEELMLEDAITITLLSVPEFRKKAGLPPRDEAGETLQTIARALGLEMIDTDGRVIEEIYKK